MGQYMSSRTEKKMAKKIPALQGPLKSWVGSTASWRFRAWDRREGQLTHPMCIAVKLNERGEGVQECARLMRNHAYKVGAWYLLPAEKIPKLRGVWVAGFRRCPTAYEIEQGCIMSQEELEVWDG